MAVTKKVVAMAHNTEHEDMSHQLVSELREEMDALKKKISQPDNKITELLLEIESLKDSIHELNVIFQQAIKETKEEDLVKIINTINKTTNEMMGQNETIAKGMLAISDKVDDFISRQTNSTSTSPVIVSSSSPSFGAGNPTMPSGMMGGMPSFSSGPSTPGPLPGSMPVSHDLGAPSFGGPRMAPQPGMDNSPFPPSMSPNFGMSEEAPGMGPSGMSGMGNFPPPPPSKAPAQKKRMGLFR
jgi:hypothetical protein